MSNLSLYPILILKNTWLNSNDVSDTDTPFYSSRTSSQMNKYELDITEGKFVSIFVLSKLYSNNVKFNL